MYKYIIALSLISFTALAQERIEYPYSLIPGGITSDADFEQHRNEGKLAEHYADVGFLHSQYLHADRKMWTSYTRDGEIFWTPVMLRKGELVLQDRYGNMIRGRCGNRLSDTPRKSVEFIPPTPGEWETPNITYAVPPLIPSPIERSISRRLISRRAKRKARSYLCQSHQQCYGFHLLLDGRFLSRLLRS